MVIKPILNKVVVLPEDQEELSKGGIVLTITKEKPGKGTVLYVGPGKWENGERVPMQIKEGDTVHYSRTFAQPIRMNDLDLVVLEEKDCLVAIEE